jgi:hypothetical protein
METQKQPSMVSKKICEGITPLKNLKTIKTFKSPKELLSMNFFSSLRRKTEVRQDVDAINSITLSSGNPTYLPTDQSKLPDCINFYISHGIAATYTEVDNLDDLMSDHFPVLLTLSNS